MTEKSKVGYISREELIEKIKNQFSPEYAEFLLIYGEYSPKVCPNCGSTSFTTLWLAKPNKAIDELMWAKWYFWCNNCFSGIRCPLLGTSPKRGPSGKREFGTGRDSDKPETF